MIIDLNVKYYYLINDDLKMSKGKIAAQVSHVAMKLGYRYGVIGTAVVLKANEFILKELINFKGIDCEYIEDAGLTEVPKGSLTCVGYKMAEGVNVEHLKLL